MCSSWIVPSSIPVENVEEEEKNEAQKRESDSESSPLQRILYDFSFYFSRIRSILLFHISSFSFHLFIDALFVLKFTFCF